MCLGLNPLVALFPGKSEIPIISIYDIQLQNSYLNLSCNYLKWSIYLKQDFGRPSGSCI